MGEAKDGREAVKLVAERHPDLVIVDIAMPFLNGIDAETHRSNLMQKLNLHSTAEIFTPCERK